MTDKLEEAVADMLAQLPVRAETGSELDALRRREAARAVIPIIRNAAMDEAAAVADEHHAGLRGIGPVGRSSVNTARIIAQAILALKGER